jgi:GNAT superfamily N-acetyltransferase
MTSFLKTDSDNNDFQQLVHLLDADLKFRDGDDHTFYAQFNKIIDIKNVIVCYVDDYAVGCGAFKPFDESAVEIKRMFVRPEFRGKGLGLEILRALELWAAECGYPACVLETGKRQAEAIQLYQKAGYGIIPNYGQYSGIVNSVCMRKSLVTNNLENIA